MAAPTAADATSIITEGLYRAGYPSPSAGLQTRATTYWLREIKNDIWRLGKRFKNLQVSYPIILNTGQVQYELPTDFSSPISAQLVHGNNTGTAQAGAAGTITLASASSFTQAYLQGKEILITGGTGVNQISRIISYNTGTKVATLEPDFSTAPDNTSTYMIIEWYWPMSLSPIWDDVFNTQSHLKTKPLDAMIVGDADTGKLILKNAPDQTYGVVLRYYANLMLLDLASTTMTTLYRYWENIFIQGVYVRALENDNRGDTTQAWQKYNNMVRELVGEETYGSELHELQRTIQ